MLRLSVTDNFDSVREFDCDHSLDDLLDLHGHTLFVKDAATLLEDFWKEVDAVLRERGSIT